MIKLLYTLNNEISMNSGICLGHEVIFIRDSKKIMKFIYFLCVLGLFFFFLAPPCGMHHLSSLTRD